MLHHRSPSFRHPPQLSQRRPPRLAAPVRPSASGLGTRSAERASHLHRVQATTENSQGSDGLNDPAPSIQPAEPTTSTAVAEEPEELFHEGSGSNSELAMALLLAPTLICLPLTIASVGRRLWFSYRFTNKRLTVTNTSPLFKSQVEIAYSKVKEIRAAPRALGLWGDMVIFLKDGGRLEIAGLERYKEIKEHIEKYITY